MKMMTFDRLIDGKNNAVENIVNSSAFIAEQEIYLSEVFAHENFESEIEDILYNQLDCKFIYLYENDYRNHYSVSLFEFTKIDTDFSEINNFTSGARECVKDFIIAACKAKSSTLYAEYSSIYREIEIPYIWDFEEDGMQLYELFAHAEEYLVAYNKLKNDSNFTTYDQLKKEVIEALRDLEKYLNNSIRGAEEAINQYMRDAEDYAFTDDFIADYAAAYDLKFDEDGNIVNDSTFIG